jgi:hypothetical protein
MTTSRDVIFILFVECFIRFYFNTNTNLFYHRRYNIIIEFSIIIDFLLLSTVYYHRFVPLQFSMA